jgi:hypothetical protein
MGHKIKTGVDWGVLSHFSHFAEFDDHGKIPSVEMIKMLAVRGSLINVRVNFGSSQQCFYERHRRGAPRGVDRRERSLSRDRNANLIAIGRAPKSG